MNVNQVIIAITDERIKVKAQIMIMKEKRDDDNRHY